ncbi:MAG: mechanosensitive ion channel family protein [Gammaproteobacteria bacterium]|jgi:MscS family membrane protein|nr:mechanosensitive ion channel family protein [Gammaproteobacteria bacterium]MCP4879961.1 mechanosensitive ion channel family protein [Gammaproteobacteria bacterium]MDP6165702.1 mechanosensitive ion channel family protein [Gammaproteobacteria bacterium]
MLHEFNQFLSIVDADLLLLIKIGLLIAVIVLAQWLTNNWITRYAQRQQQLDITLLHAARRPLLLGLWLLGFSWIGEVLASAIKNESLALLSQIREPLLVILLAWFLIRVISILQALLLSPSASRLAWDASTAEAVGKVLKIIVVISALLMMMQLFGLSISGVLAFGGVGGIAIGFAAKDMLANFFGGLMIYMDRQFSVGDWVRSPDKQIEGTVEHIGWRVTRIRTFDMRPLYVPNATFTSISVENPSRMSNRRFYETFGLRYADQTHVAAIVADIKAMLLGHEAIDTGQTLMVNLNEFNSHSVDFFVYCFTKTTAWAEFHVIKQELLQNIADIVEHHGAEFAFPTQSLHIMQQDNDPQP